jgi:hypothetical protein
MARRSGRYAASSHCAPKAAKKLGISEVPVILRDEWTPAQVRAFRLMVNRSVTWADWDEELLSLELQDLMGLEFDLSLTGFNSKEIDDLLAMPDEEKANETPPVPENPVSRSGDLWICGKHRVLCGDATRPEDVARLLGDRKPILMVTDPPYGIELDSEWRDRAGLNGCGPAESSYMKKRTTGHTETTISGDRGGASPWPCGHIRALPGAIGLVRGIEANSIGCALRWTSPPAHASLRERRSS